MPTCPTRKTPHWHRTFTLGVLWRVEKERSRLLDLLSPPDLPPNPFLALFQSVDLAGGTDQHNVPFNRDRAENHRGRLFVLTCCSSGRRDFSASTSCVTHGTRLFRFLGCRICFGHTPIVRRSTNKGNSISLHDRFDKLNSEFDDSLDCLPCD